MKTGRVGVALLLSALAGIVGCDSGPADDVRVRTHDRTVKTRDDACFYACMDQCVSAGYPSETCASWCSGECGGGGGECVPAPNCTTCGVSVDDGCGGTAYCGDCPPPAPDCSPTPVCNSVPEGCGSCIAGAASDGSAIDGYLTTTTCTSCQGTTTTTSCTYCDTGGGGNGSGNPPPPPGMCRGLYSGCTYSGECCAGLNCWAEHNCGGGDQWCGGYCM
jgi:hypothetical protein